MDIIAALCLVSATVCWGVVPIMLRYLAGPGLVPDGFAANMVRYPLAAICYLPWLIGGLRRGNARRFWLAALLPTAINVVAQTLWACAPYHLEAGMVGFLVRLSVVWSILGAFWLFPDERRLARKPRFWAGAGLAFAGFVTMSVPQLNLSAGGNLTGIVIIFVCSIFWGLYGVTVRYVIGNVHPLFAFSVISSYTSIALIGLGPLGEPAALLRLGPGPMAIVALSALVGIAMAHGLYYTAIQRIGVAVSSISMMVAPFVTVIGSYWVLGERFSAAQWIGGLTLAGGAALATYSHPRTAPANLPDPHELGSE